MPVYPKDLLSSHRFDHRDVENTDT
jgi:hypothetical protein